MSKVDQYRQLLRSLTTWDMFLIEESRLPGPRANLELAFAVAHEGSEDLFVRYANLAAEEAPNDSPEGFLAFCGVLGLGYLLARGKDDHFSTLRERASDPRWRIREAVALGLQKYGQRSMEKLVERMWKWSKAGPFEKRAAVAALCEPSLLKDQTQAQNVLNILNEMTESILDEEDRRSEGFKALRKGLAYGWSVVVAAQPSIGKPRMEKWIGSADSDIRWIMRQNLKKKRLSRMDEEWVKAQMDVLAG